MLALASLPEEISEEKAKPAAGANNKRLAAGVRQFLSLLPSHFISEAASRDRSGRPSPPSTGDTLKVLVLALASTVER